jgi:hypothetical protein
MLPSIWGYPTGSWKVCCVKLVEMVNEEVATMCLLFEQMECRDTHISFIATKSLAELLETCWPQEGLKSKAPKHLEILGRTIRCAHHREAFVPDVKILGAQSRLAGLQKHTDHRRSHIQGAQLGWQSRRHTKVLQDLDIMARQPQEGHFGA